MILEKRSVRLCERISTIDEVQIIEIWEQQRSKEHFTRLPPSVHNHWFNLYSSTYITFQTLAVNIENQKDG
ncbi:hypothetical protein PAJ34TS1_25510 [Paenibacillus azoreducens]|uniref:Uncharacterized protein n=1 Tax=Paenibacillus azoreducens TaxID=116718 RepID=A0A920CRB2_9BACL|nr:hypothetical protein J34TS1_09020 [Paenibacillus azoreducens]